MKHENYNYANYAVSVLVRSVFHSSECFFSHSIGHARWYVTGCV